MNKSERNAQRKSAIFSSGCGVASKFLLITFLAFMLLSVSQVYAAAPLFTESIKALTLGNNKILITFSEAVSGTSGGSTALDAADFTMGGTDSLTISSVAHTAGSKYAILTMSGTLDIDGAGQVTIACAAASIYDNNGIAPCVQGATDVNAAATDTTGPTISTVTLADSGGNTAVSAGDSVVITFDEPMAIGTIAGGTADTDLALNNGHTFDAAGTGGSVTWDVDRKVATVVLGSSTTVADLDTINPAVTVTDALENVDNTVTKSILDTTKPTVASAKVTGANAFTVVFSEPVAAAFTDFSDLKGGIGVRGTTAGSSGNTNTIVVTFNGAATATDGVGTVDLAATIQDLAGTPNFLVLVDDRVLADGQKPTFTAVRTALNTITLTFSENVDTTATDGTGYTLSAGTVTATSDPAGASATMTLTTAGIAGTTATPTVTYNTALGTTVDGAANEVLDSANAVASDAVSPTVTANDITTGDGIYVAGQNIDITITYSEAVTIESGIPTLTLNTAPARSATYNSGNGTTDLVFRYTVQAGDTAADLGATSVNAIVLGAATIKDAAGNDAVNTLLDDLTAGNAVVISGPIKVTVTREVGGVDSGFTVEVRCTGGAYNQLTGSPTTNASGSVSAEPVAGSSCDNGDSIDVRVSKDGYVTKEDIGITTYPGADISITGVQYAYKITSILAEATGAELKATATIVKTGNAQGTTCVQGGDTNWYCAVPLADDTLAIQVTKAGYIQDNTSLAFTTDRTVATAVQEAAITGSVKYTVVVTSVVDELGNAHTIDGADVTITSTNGTAAYSGGMAFIDADPAASPVTLTAAKSGFYTSTMGGVVPSAAAQNQVNFTSSVNSLKFNISMTLNATTARIGDTVFINATGFPAMSDNIYMNISGTIVSLTGANGTVAGTIPGTVKSDLNGKWNATFVLTDMTNGTKTALGNNGSLAYNATATLTVLPKVVSILPISGNINSTAVNSTAIITVTGFNASTGLTVRFNTTLATINSGGTTDANGSASTINVTIPAIATGVYYINVSDATGQNATLTSAFTVIDAIPPVINSVYLNESDNFVSATAPNNAITLIVNATDFGYGATGIKNMTANFSALGQAGLTTMNMTYNATTGLWNATALVTNVTGLEFAAKNITVYGYDNNSNYAVGGNFTTVVLYNMTTPPADPTNCTQWDALTTDLSTVTNFSAVNMVLAVKVNVSCYMPALASIPGIPAWVSQFTLLGLVNFTSLDMSSPGIGAQLALLPTNMNVSITPPWQFGDSRIYFNTTALAAFGSNASITMYHLPFSSMPNVTADPLAAGINGSLTWTQGIGEGTLTFAVNGFSGYNVTDSVAPVISVISPANGSTTNDFTPLVNISVNGTGTQLSQITININSSSLSFYYQSVNGSVVTNTANCMNASTGSELFYCTPTIASNLSSGSHNISVSATDLGGVSGNSATIMTSFSINDLAPVVTLNSPAAANITKLSTMLFNWSITSTVSSSVSCNLTINGTVNQSNIVSVNGTWTNKTVSSLANGSYTWSVTCNDSAGNIGTSATNTFIVDNVAPVINILHPANGVSTNENNTVPGNVSLTFNVTDNVYSVVTCAAYYGNGTAMYSAHNATADGSSQSAGYLMGSNGVVSWYMNCTDGVGNIGLSSNYTFIRDTVSPLMNNATINETYVKVGKSVWVSVGTTDATSGVVSVTANGVALNGSNASLWNGTITIPSGSDGAKNMTIIATDNASNTNVTYIGYTLDNTAPVITLNSPTNGSTAISTAGELIINWTVTEMNISASNISIDNGVWTKSNNSNGTLLASLTGVGAGTHTLVIYALDNASLSATSTTTFILSAPVNATAALATMQTSVGNATLTNITLSDVTTNTNQSGNQTLNVSQPLKLEMGVNASTTGADATVTIPAFTGTDANWNATTFNITTNLTGNVALNTSAHTGSSIISLVNFVNMSSFLPNTAYTNGTTVVFQYAMTSGIDVLYLADDVGNVVYKLGTCPGLVPPATVSSATMCYLNTSTTVTAYIPHLSGAALSNDTLAPTVNITSPATNLSTVANSYLTFSFDAWEANPNATRFCWYNLTNASNGQIRTANLTTASFTQVGTKYSFSTLFSALPNLAYNITVNCTDQNGNSSQVRYVFTIADTTAPTVTAISSSVSGSSVTLSVTTDEIAECRYYASDANYSNMTVFGTTNSTTHSTAMSLSAGTYTYYVRCNDTIGNNMTSSNTTTFTISPSGGTCTPSWSCTDWSTCSPSNTQVRTCTDANLCGINSSKPSESQYCIYNAPATCTGTCGLGYYQQPYPGCACVLLTCTNTCAAGQTRNAYPDCTCVSPVTNVTPPGAITITPKRDGVVIDIPAIAEDRSTSLGSYLTTAVKDATGVLDIVLTPNKDLTGVKVDIVKLASKPTTIAAPQGITVYSYLEIKATNLTADDLVNATVTFKVSKAYIGTKYNASSAVLMRLVGSEWTILDTRVASQTTSDYIFEAKTPGFSYFAIAIAEMGAPPIVIVPQGNVTNETGTTVPPIEIGTIAIWVVGIVVAAGILAFAYQKVQSKKKWKSKK